MHTPPFPFFGAIADDYTGGSDLAGMLYAGGVPTVQLFGPSQDNQMAEQLRDRFGAIVVCLKSRSIDPEQARRQSLEALDLLTATGARQIQFKYCSTFDSTARGNIGPVTDALMTRLNTNFTVAVPSLPVNGRTQYLGHLFVNGRLLSESPMRNHPLNPMDDPDLVRHLQKQTDRRVGLLNIHHVRRGQKALRDQMERLQREGVEIALVDVLEDSDLETIAEGVADMPLITGGSGLASGLARVWRAQGWIEEAGVRLRQPPQDGNALILSGSCSAATIEQLRVLEESGVRVLHMNLDLLLSDPAGEADRLQKEARRALGDSHLAAIASSASPRDRAALEERLGPAAAGQLSEAIEQGFAELARRLVGTGPVSKLIVAGGETAGAVINSLQVKAVELTGIIDPGVPSLRTVDGSRLNLALKSGNFGSPEFFLKTLQFWDQQ